VLMSDVVYDLPEHAIAQRPVEPRDAARLLVDRGPITGVEHRHVRDLPQLLQRGDLLVVNDTRVLPARLGLHRSTGGQVEVLLLERRNDTATRWAALVRPSRKIAVDEIVSAGPLQVRVGEKLDDTGQREVEILGEDPLGAIQQHGQLPLPPYITERPDDPDRYQTVYARRAASAAAPTAGLHFTDDLLARLADAGVGLARVELVVGLDTFRPVAVENPADHPMHTEAYRVPPETIDALAKATRVVAVGTTSARALESYGTTGEAIGRTNLFIRRPYPWKYVDVLMTNFHLPRTTLLLMIDAFIGPRWRNLYETALANDYRFLSFGDAMLLERNRDLQG
jgi:S-adenosylmethionine:tRNA ribosyltransferase-isomerase